MEGYGCWDPKGLGVFCFFVHLLEIPAYDGMMERRHVLCVFRDIFMAFR